MTVDEHFFTEEEHGGAGCVMISPADIEKALSETTWIGRDLGDFGIVTSFRTDEFTVEPGLQSVDHETEVIVEFLAQVRRPSGGTPVADIALPFLWFWDAYRFDEGWKYVNSAGRERELVRWDLNDDAWQLEIRALELRQYLFRIGKVALLQRDYVLKRDVADFGRFDEHHRSDWAHFHLWASSERAIGSRSAFSGLMGQYVVTGADTDRAPRFLESDRDVEYPSFIYAIDPDSGKPLRHTIDPGELGTYFDKDSSRLHYLTPAYFKREVLQPYAAEPSRYTVTSTRLSCLGLWGIDISMTKSGLVEVYLGDLGRDMPQEEWGHWLTYNVPPDGPMNEARFRRDFLNQWVNSDDALTELRLARSAASSASQPLLGQPLWRPLEAEFAREFESLLGPLSADPTSLNGPILVLTKALVDAIDPTSLKAKIVAEKGEGSLSLLKRWLESLGDASDISAPLRDLQALRSRGGVAHLKNSESAAAASKLGIVGRSPQDAFDIIVRLLAGALSAMRSLMDAVNPSSEAPTPSSVDETSDGPR